MYVYWWDEGVGGGGVYWWDVVVGGGGLCIGGVWGGERAQTGVYSDIKCSCQLIRLISCQNTQGCPSCLCGVRPGPSHQTHLIRQITISLVPVEVALAISLISVLISIMGQTVPLEP